MGTGAVLFIGERVESILVPLIGTCNVRNSLFALVLGRDCFIPDA